MRTLLFLGLFLLSVASSGLAQTGITLALGNAVAGRGELVCVDVTVADFSDILSMQYSIQWDKNILELKEVSGFRLPYLNQNNFGLHKKEDGVLTFVWIDNSLQGTTFPDGTAIYQLCFQVKGNVGQQAYLAFSETPTPFESINKAEQAIPIHTVAGGVRVK